MGTLSIEARFAWGSVAALVMMLVGLVLPRLIEYVRGQTWSPRWGLLRFLAFLLVLGIASAAGGLTAILLNPVDVSGAVGAGLLWTGFMKGFAEAMREISHADLSANR